MTKPTQFSKTLRAWMDAFMHRIGLHGKAVIPFVLGYGCTVPAIMSTRILESPRDRLLTASLVNFIPCAARSTVIFALVGFTMGPLTALGLYVLNLFVVAAAGRLLIRIHPEASPGMILELPGYKIPTASAVAQKTWFRMREFIFRGTTRHIARHMTLPTLFSH